MCESFLSFCSEQIPVGFLVVCVCVFVLLQFVLLSGVDGGDDR